LRFEYPTGGIVVVVVVLVELVEEVDVEVESPFVVGAVVEVVVVVMTASAEEHAAATRARTIRSEIRRDINGECRRGLR
jgi:hypothetical protein